MIGAITAGLFAGGVPAVTNSYESIATVQVGSGTATEAIFSSIPSTYKHLQLRISANNYTYVNLFIQYNGDTGNNYDSHYLYGDGSSAASGNQINNSNSNIGYTTVGGSNFGVAIVDILDYTNTNKNTTLRSLAGTDNNGSGLIALYSGLWRNTAAVNQIRILSNAGGGFNQYTKISLYGIRG